MKSNKQPLVSVVMPVYNAGEYLVDAIESILSQTYKNWELIAIDDASKDESYAILRAYAARDSRIKVFKNDTNSGVSATASKALAKAKGEFVARMDADDISAPSRFEKQVEYLVTHPDTVILGTQCMLIDSEGEFTGYKKFPVKFEEIKKMMFFTIPMQQPSMMMNRRLIPDDFVWYDKNFNVAEEVELLFKLFKYGKAVNLPEVLLKYRIHGKNISLTNPKKTFYLTLRTRVKAIFKYGYRPTAKGVAITLGQAVGVSILPESWIFPIYTFMRGMKQKTSSIKAATQLAVEPLPA